MESSYGQKLVENSCTVSMNFPWNYTVNDNTAMQLFHGQALETHGRFHGYSMENPRKFHGLVMKLSLDFHGL